MILSKISIHRPAALILAAATATFGCTTPQEEPSPDAGCPLLQSIPDRGDLPLSPRQSPAAETLALRCSEGFVADQALYDTLHADLAAIERLDPRMTPIVAFNGERALRGLIIETTDPAAASRLLRGEVEAAACLLDPFGAQLTEVQSRYFQLLVTFDGIFWLEGLVPLLESLPEIHQAEIDYFVGDGPRVHYNVRSSPRRYLFDDAGGDCPAGCTTHHFFLWEIPDDAPPALVAEWGRDDDGEFGQQPPGFSLEPFTCRRCPDGRVAQDEAEVCDDGIDNDCDGDLDCDDPECAPLRLCAPEVCDNDDDDNDDGLTDCDDPQCQFNVACGTPTCRSDADQALLTSLAERSGLWPFIVRDALACDPSSSSTEDPPADVITECIARTFTFNGASPACGHCLGQLGECSRIACRQRCYEPHDPDCRACADDACMDDAARCLGEPFTALE